MIVNRNKVNLLIEFNDIILASEPMDGPAVQ